YTSARRGARGRRRETRRPLSPTRMPQRAWFAAAVVACATFALYYATLLPGLDFGDTGSFQTLVAAPLITPRNAYPLYFALGKAIFWLTHMEPAHALNFVSALEGAVACGIVVLAAAELSGSADAGAAAAL